MSDNASEIEDALTRAFEAEALRDAYAKNAREWHETAVSIGAERNRLRQALREAVRRLSDGGEHPDVITRLQEALK
jgi:uncharacterized coiled-coil DUF342 family protein